MLRNIAIFVRFVWALLLLAGTLAHGDCAPTPSILRPGQVSHCPLAGGESHTYRLSLPAHQFADIRLEKNGIQLSVRVAESSPSVTSGEQPTLADYDNDSKLKDEEHLGVFALSAAVYQIQVRARYAHAPAGTFAFELRSIRPATHEDELLYQARELSTQAKLARDAGHYRQSLGLAQQALSLAEEALGPDASYVGELAQRLGAIQLLTGDREQAAANFQRAIRIDQATLDPNSQQLAVALLGMGNVYIAANDYSKAEDNLKQALDISTRNQGPESPEVAECLASVSLLDQR